MNKKVVGLQSDKDAGYIMRIFDNVVEDRDERNRFLDNIIYASAHNLRRVVAFLSSQDVIDIHVFNRANILLEN